MATTLSLGCATTGDGKADASTPMSWETQALPHSAPNSATLRITQLAHKDHQWPGQPPRAQEPTWTRRYCSAG